MNGASSGWLNRIAPPLFAAMLAFPSASPAQVQVGPWQTTSVPIGAMSNNGIAATSSHMYAITVGGVAELAPILPDGSLGPWSQTTSIGESRNGAAVVVANGRLYVLVGPAADSAPILSDGSLGPWSATFPTQLQRINHAAAAADGRIYVVGAYEGTTSVESAAIAADGTLTWRWETSLVEKREGPALVASSGFLYALGGYKNGPFLTSVERAAIGPDGTLGPWSLVTPMQIARYFPGAVAAYGSLIVLGGWTGVESSTAVETAIVESAGLSAWALTSATQQPRSSATVSGRFIYAAGFPNAPSPGIEYALIFPPDPDGDGVSIDDNCPDVPNPQQADVDSDGAGDACDPCPGDPDDDLDQDGFCADIDNCPTLANADQSDTDADGIGDTCDTDIDGDGVTDTAEPSFCRGSSPAAPTTEVGCSTDQVCPCGAPLGRSAWNNRGEYRRCVKEAVKELLRQGRISATDRSLLVRSARDSSCGVY